MAFGEDILKLRQRVQDAIRSGVVAQDGKEIFEATLIQIMNDAERNRQNCVTQAENLRRQASVFDGQAGAFASVSSIIYNVLNGFVTLAEKDEEDRKRAEEERLANAEDLKKAEELEKAASTTVSEENTEEPKKKSSRKKNA
jgi:hypothetical protein